MYEANASYKKGDYGEYYIESVAFPGKVLTDSSWDGRAGYNGEGYDLALTEPKSFRWELEPTNAPAPDIPVIDGKADFGLEVQHKFKVWGWANTDRVRVKVENILAKEITLINPNHEKKSFEQEYQLPEDVFDTHSYEIEAYKQNQENRRGNLHHLATGT